jgi:hypothetical protein
MSLVLRSLKRVGRWAAGPAALLAGLSAHGLPGLIVLACLVVVLAVLSRGMIRWIIASGARSDRVTRMIVAWRSGQSHPSSAASGSVPRLPSRAAAPQGQKGDGPLRQQGAVGMVKASSRKSSL